VTSGTWSIELKPLYIFGCESKRCKNDVSSDGLNDEEEGEEEEEEVETNSLSKLVAALEAVVIVVTFVWEDNYIFSETPLHDKNKQITNHNPLNEPVVEIPPYDPKDIAHNPSPCAPWTWNNEDV
jgi:hypothetical protein